MIPLLFLTIFHLQKPVVGNEHFTVESIVYTEATGLSVTCYTGDYINIGKILPEDQQFGQIPSNLILLFPGHS
jgi:hypothetical protein